MAEKDPEHDENAAPLSATAMFLRSFEAMPKEPAAKAETSPAASPSPAHKSAEAEHASGGQGEFTRMFQTLGQPDEARRAAPTPGLPDDVSASRTPAGPGEFTRAFQLPPRDPAATPAQKTPSPQPGIQAPAATRSKGFSTPGVSDSASAEGSFTRIFRPAPTPSVPVPQTEEVPRISADQPAQEVSRLSHALNEPTRREPVDPVVTPSPSGITELFRALSSEGERERDRRAYSAEPARAYQESTRPPQPDTPSNILPAGGGVTSLLNRLSADTPLPGASPKTDTYAPVLPQQIQEEPAPADTRGEFTRIIDAAQIQQALAAAQPPASSHSAAVPAAPAAVVSFTPPAVSVPKLPPVAVPTTKATAAPTLPTLAVPAIPKVQLPAVALSPAPKSKMQEMLPLLLIANAFLMLVLILLVVFALHRR